ncbi:MULTISPECIES: hypothetical protein [unclassified Streptomyces]
MFREDPRGIDIQEKLAYRRWVTTGDYRAVEEFEQEAYAAA